MKTVVALPGEGIGPEVVDATCEVLVGTGLPLKILTPPQGAAAVKSHGVPLPDESKQAARAADGVLFGAAGGPDTSAVVGWLRWEMSAWGGARLIKFHPGMRSPLADPEGIDYVIVRENSEGMYPGREGDLEDLARVMPDLKDKSGKTVKEYGPGRFAVKVVTPVGPEGPATLGGLERPSHRSRLAGRWDRQNQLRRLDRPQPHPTDPRVQSDLARPWGRPDRRGQDDRPQPRPTDPSRQSDPECRRGRSARQRREDRRGTAHERVLERGCPWRPAAAPHCYSPRRTARYLQREFRVSSFRPPPIGESVRMSVLDSSLRWSGLPIDLGLLTRVVHQADEKSQLRWLRTYADGPLSAACASLR